MRCWYSLEKLGDHSHGQGLGFGGGVRFIVVGYSFVFFFSKYFFQRANRMFGNKF